MGQHQFTLTWEADELANIKLDAADLALLRECDKSLSVADKLLGLECLARRLEQHVASNPQPPRSTLP